MNPTRPRANAVALPNAGRERANAVSAPSGNLQNVGRNAQAGVATQQLVGSPSQNLPSMSAPRTVMPATRMLDTNDTQGARANVASTLTPSQSKVQINS